MNAYAANPAAQAVPEIYFEYGSILDEVIAENRSVLCEISDKNIDLIKNVRVKLNEAWKKNGKSLLTDTVDIMQRGFAKKELSVYLSLCNVPSMSTPPIVNILEYLPTFVKRNRKLDVIFEGLIFHEILHSYLTENWPTIFRNSRLTKKYRADGMLITNHLHLLSIQKMIYLLQNREDDLKFIIADDSRFPAYKRAWQIVNQFEDYKAFIFEILQE